MIRLRRSRGRAVALSAAAIAAAGLPAAARAHSGAVLRGLGTATIDGMLAPGEWDGAARVDFLAEVPAIDGGGTVPATLRAMNDGTALYLSVQVGYAAGTVEPEFDFDNNHSGTRDPGDDTFFASVSPSNVVTFVDDFRFGCPGAPPGTTWCGLFDTDADPALPPPGTTDGTAGASRPPGVTVVELAHPLDSADDAHDFSLHVGSVVGVEMRLLLLSAVIPCTPVPSACYDDTYLPPGIPVEPDRWMDVRITSGNRTAPETEIGSGPEEASVTADPQAAFAFTGRDDVIAPTELVFECRLDGAPFEPCTSPRSLVVGDGRHTFAVRAVDEALNVDATPAQRAWTVDTVPPTKPRIAGPRRTRSHRPTFRFTATDEIAPTSALRFRCAFDSTRLRACGRRYSRRLARGRHLLRVQAADEAGNASSVATRKVEVR
jgi:hypothetical protein